MKSIQAVLTDHNKQFPEQFAWELLDSITLSKHGMTLAHICRLDLTTEDRRLVPGLRYAMLQILMDTSTEL